MKKEANAASTPATTMSMARMPLFIAIAIGESLSPKHTGHASAMRGAARSATVRSVVRITGRSAEAIALQFQLAGLPLERRAVERQTDAGGERGDSGHRIGDIAGGPILLARP